MHSLGIDLGSSTIKGAVLDLEQRSLRSFARADFPTPISGLPSGRFEIDPQAILSATKQVLHELLDAAPEATSLFFSGQMGGTVLVNASGAALTNYLSWRDQRTREPTVTGESYLTEIRKRWQGRLLTELGNELQPGSTASLLFWLHQQKQLPAGAMPATVADFVIGQLCGQPPQMHPTHALGMLILTTGAWHREAFSALELDAISWPQLANLQTPIGFYRANGRMLRCFASVGDQQAALRGVGLNREELSINVSTGSQVSRRTATFEPGPYQTRPFFGGDFLNTITHLPAGRSLNVLVDLLTELAHAEGVTLRQPWTTIIERTAAIQQHELEVDLAFFAGPLGSCGKISEITTENLTVGHLFQAAFRSMAENYRLCAERLSPDCSWSRLVLSGGLTQSVSVLRQNIQDRFNAPLRDSLTEEETLAGLLELAFEATNEDARLFSNGGSTS